MSGQFFVPRAGPGKVSNLWIWKISPKNPKFSFFSLWVKKISTGRIKKYPVERRVGLLFTAGQKYACVRSGPICNFLTWNERRILFLPCTPLKGAAFQKWWLLPWETRHQMRPILSKHWRKFLWPKAWVEHRSTKRFPKIQKWKWW